MCLRVSAVRGAPVPCRCPMGSRRPPAVLACALRPASSCGMASVSSAPAPTWTAHCAPDPATGTALATRRVCATASQPTPGRRASPAPGGEAATAAKAASQGTRVGLQRCAESGSHDGFALRARLCDCRQLLWPRMRRVPRRAGAQQLLQRARCVRRQWDQHRHWPVRVRRRYPAGGGGK